MALIGKLRLTQAVITLDHSSRSETIVGLKAGEGHWLFTGPGSASQTQNMIVEQLVKQGYKLVSTGSNTVTLQLENPDAPEDAGPTAKFGMTDVNKKGCYIATACYGSYEHPDVLVFRRWRDEFLMQSPFGRFFVRFYYRVSPSVAARVARLPQLSFALRRLVLEPLARRLR